MHIRKALSPSQKATASTPTPTEGEKNEEDEDDRVLNEMEELTYAMDRQKKREKKLLAKKRAKVGCLASPPSFPSCKYRFKMPTFCKMLEDLKFDQYIWPSIM